MNAPVTSVFADAPDDHPGRPLPELAGHVSLGRLERVLKAGQFAVTAELNPPDSANPDDVYERVAPFDGYVDGINATDGSGANCHMSSADPADFLPRLQSHRYPGQCARRGGAGRLQRLVPVRRWRAERRSSRGEAGLRP
jgi:hypothetical protein